MENQTTQPSLFNNAIKNGLILGGISIVLVLIIYVVNFEWLVSMKMLLITLIISIGYAAYSGIAYRKEIGGYMAFGKAFQHGLIMFMVSSFIYTLFSIVLYTVIDPELPSKLTDAAVANAESMMQSFGMPEDKMEEALDQARVDTEKRFTISGMLLGFVYSIIMNAIFALISGAIVKKKEPEMV